jgi:hypothetical protein
VAQGLEEVPSHAGLLQLQRALADGSAFSSTVPTAAQQAAGEEPPPPPPPPPALQMQLDRSSTEELRALFGVLDRDQSVRAHRLYIYACHEIHRTSLRRRRRRRLHALSLLAGGWCALNATLGGTRAISRWTTCVR